LSQASPEARRNFRLIGHGEAVHWPELDEDISAWEMLAGAPTYRKSQTA
jgi:hypothetical protein